MRFAIVQPTTDASPETRILFAQLAPGSIAVAVSLTDHPGIMIYYEGGIYERQQADGSFREATPEERRNYAIHAADRAATNYPTIAEFWLANPEDLEEIGFVNTDPFIVRFFGPEGFLSDRPNPWDMWY